MHLRDRNGSHSAGGDLRLPRRTTSETAHSLRIDAPTPALNLCLAHTRTAINPPGVVGRLHLGPLSPHGLGWAHKNHSRPAFPPTPSLFAQDEALSLGHPRTAPPSPADDVLAYANEPHPSAPLRSLGCPYLFLHPHPDNKQIYPEGRTKKVTTSDRSEAEWRDLQLLRSNCSQLRPSSSSHVGKQRP